MFWIYPLKSPQEINLTAASIWVVVAFDYLHCIREDMLALILLQD